MKSILLITWANIKRRKIQTLLVVVCIALAALMFSTLIGIGLGMSQPFENLYARLKASHILMNFDINEHDPKQIKAWFEKQPEVIGVTAPRIVRSHGKKPIFRGKEIINNAQFWEHPGNAEGQDQLHILEGGDSAYPAPGEIWIPNSWKNKSKINLGDTLQIPTDNGLFPLKVSGIVVNAQHSNGLMNPVPVWVGPGTLPLLFPVNDLSRVIMGIRVNDEEVTEKVWARFHQEYEYRGFGTLYDFYKKIFQIIHQITGGLLLVLAIFGIIITLTITSSVVNSAIKTDYKMIGMLKAQGFTNRNVITVYVIQFLAITCVAVPIGLFAGYFMTQMVFKDLIAAIGAINFNISWFLPAIFTFIFFLIGILFITYRTAAQAGEIQPVTAIRFGGPPQRSFAGSKFSLFTLGPRSQLPVFLGLRMLMSNKKRAFLLFIGLLFVVFVQILYTNVDNSILNLDDNRPSWGYTNSDMFIDATTPLEENEEDIFKEFLEDDERVKAVVKMGVYGANLPAAENKAPQTFIGFIYDDELEKLDLVNLEGRHPVFETEISIGINSSKELNKGLGDTLDIFMEGQLVPFTITGIYQHLSNLSEGFKMRIEGVRELNPLYQLRRYNVILYEEEDKEAFREEILETYGSTYKVRTDSESQSQLKNIIAGIKNVFVLVSMLFLGVLFVTVFNDTVLSIRENQKNLGILKAIGLTPWQLQLALVLKAIFIAILALAIGIPLSLQIIPHAMDILTSNVGLAQFPYVFDLNKTLLNIPIILGLTIGSVWIASQRLLKIRPRILVRE